MCLCGFMHVSEGICEAKGSTGAGAAGYYEVPSVVAGNWPWILCTEPYLQLHVGHLINIVVHVGRAP